MFALVMKFTRSIVVRLCWGASVAALRAEPANILLTPNVDQPVTENSIAKFKIDDKNNISEVTVTQAYVDKINSAWKQVMTRNTSEDQILFSFIVSVAATAGSDALAVIRLMRTELEKGSENL